MLATLRMTLKPILVTLGMLSGQFVAAADGCKFLLCIAGPWQQIVQCRPTVLEVFRDLALGRPFPACDLSGEGNSAASQWTTEETCPNFYRHYHPNSGAYLRCTFAGKIDVLINGSLWSTVYWDRSGRAGTSTWYSDEARTSLTADLLDPRYDADKAAWDALHPPVPPDGDVGGG